MSKVSKLKKPGIMLIARHADVHADRLRWQRVQDRSRDDTKDNTTLLHRPMRRTQTDPGRKL